MRAGREDDERLMREVLRLNGKILGITLGTVAALTIFIATNWLVLKGGDRVGPHLQLLSQFFIGYSVSFQGSLIGSAYAFFGGCISGWLIAALYNRIAGALDN